MRLWALGIIVLALAALMPLAGQAQEMDLLCPYAHPGLGSGQPDLSTVGSRVPRDGKTCRSPWINWSFEVTPIQAAIYDGVEDYNLVHVQTFAPYVHAASALDPRRTLSVYEPGAPGGCGDGDHRTIVSETAARHDCIYATNAGFFNTHDGTCYGDIVSDGRLVQADNHTNVQFGVRHDNTIQVSVALFSNPKSQTASSRGLPASPIDRCMQVGYFQLDGNETRAEDFQFLITGACHQKLAHEASESSMIGSCCFPHDTWAHKHIGAIWLVRNGQVYVNESIAYECSNIEESGSLQEFANLQSARTALAHDSNGAVRIVQHNGQSGHYGINLYEFAKYLKQQGVVNAINLDGGGSSVSVVNNSVVSFPTDGCGACNCPFPNADSTCYGMCADRSEQTCERKVTTILCLHRPLCNNGTGCGNHGVCRNGACHCDVGYTGDACRSKLCNLGGGCGDHGTCYEGTCRCDAGYNGAECQLHTCNEDRGCGMRGTCQDGVCFCADGYSGTACLTPPVRSASSGARVAYFPPKFAPTPSSDTLPKCHSSCLCSGLHRSPALRRLRERQNPRLTPRTAGSTRSVKWPLWLFLSLPCSCCWPAAFSIAVLSASVAEVARLQAAVCVVSRTMS
ncbi:uncharacterized protein MONBRDRAFT_37217 [Monosiga brevicollis MX1]|uniref:EGF-like domain-containing protein n=1 Tax=Monosiga brevicollis TaxID=81824 RepID=A9V0B9_MONBE|nr:uncharacterized protein MONBRDRAFT_37217 [Monosiga brevicollis MX1]EDQ89131.1 predicted protein [Monosiga brevicollis MX1]|eukprot:XP_001746236.1 hypothetical protein [Monosiga brevicollis MX1]